MNMPERWPTARMPQEDEGRLILIGYWLGPYAPGWPDVRDLVDPTWDGRFGHQLPNWRRRHDVNDPSLDTAKDEEHWF
jgi:hypothetical protein